MMKLTKLRGAPRIFVFMTLATLTQVVSLAQESAPEYKVAKDKLSAYIGEYRYDDDSRPNPSIFLNGDQLVIESARSPRQQLVPQRADVFTPTNNPEPIVIKFVYSPDGKVSGFLRIAADNGTRHVTKISDHPQTFDKPQFSREEVMIPMRDGVKLHAVVLTPKDLVLGSWPLSSPAAFEQAPPGSLPILFERTPYGVDGRTSDSINARYSELVKDRYIFVFEDIRGRYGSEGTFVMSRAMVDHKNPKLVDESTDAYDSVAWLISNVKGNNGRVGVFGISYPGFLAQAAGIDPHSAVKAISPQAPMIDVWMGDDFFHNGAFRQSYGYDYTQGMESSKENAFGKLDQDAYDFFLHTGSFAAASKTSGVDKLPTGIGFLQNPAYDDFWRSRGVEYHLKSVAVPTLLVGGFWDQEDMYGPQKAYETLEPYDKSHDNFLIIGPWNHGQWGGTTSRLGAIEFGERTTDEFRERYEAPFFAHYLHGKNAFVLQNTATFESGRNQWRTYAHWPPPESRPTNFFLISTGLGPQAGLLATADGGVVGGTVDTASHGPAEYLSDPANPIPYRHRPIQATYSPGSQWYTWLVEDQKTLLAGRNDYASWSTPVLEHDITIAGDVIADLFASTSGTDSDWVVKLIDEYPATPTTEAPTAIQIPGQPLVQAASTANSTPSYQLMINAEVFRGRYRESFEHPTAIPANKIEEYKFSLHAADHTFLKGHKIVVQVQSTWFPLYDRNPQKFIPNIMLASPPDFQAATQRIYPQSHLILPILQ